MSVDESSLLLAAVPQACRVTKKKCKELKLEHQFVEDTWDAIWRAMVDDFNELFDDALGIIWVATQDCEHLAKDYRLPNHGADLCCMRCGVNKGSVPITEVGPNAKFMCHCYSPQQLAKNPLTDHPFLRIKGFSHFTWVYDPMHCKEIGCSSHSVANMFYDVVFKELRHMKNNPERLRKLNSLIMEAYEEMGVATENRINFAIDFKHFFTTHKEYPDLMHSAIKARKTRYLVPVAFWLAKHFRDSEMHDEEHYAARRFFCLKNLNMLYDMEDAHRLFLPRDVAKQYMASTHKFLEHYLYLAKVSMECKKQIGSFQWSFVPKFHFIIHIAEDAQYLSPRAFWAYRGESMVGIIASVAESCLHGMPAWRVSETLCTKYRVAKHLQLVFLAPG